MKTGRFEGTPRLAGSRITLAAAVALTAVGLVLATRTSFFYGDDYLNIGLARQSGLSLAFLKLNVFGVLAPGHRLLDWLMGTQLGLHWEFAIAIFVLCWLCAVVAFARVVEELGASGWLVALTTVLFASSPAFVRVMQWWANGEHVVPSMALTLVALAAALRWLRTHSGISFVVCVLAYAAGLMFYAKPVLLPLYIVFLAYVVPSRAREPRLRLGQLRRDAPLLVAVGVITLAYVAAVEAGGYVQLPKTVGVATWVHFLRFDWLQGVTPWLVGQTPVPFRPPPSTLVVALAELVLVLLMVTSIIRSRSAWRAWAFYLVAWLANSVIVGRDRLGLFGPTIGSDPRYNAELAFLLPLAISVAFSAPARRFDWSAIEGRFKRIRAKRSLTVAAALAAAGMASSLGVSYARLAAAWPAGEAGTWVAHVRSSAAALHRRGIQPSVLDGQVPSSLGAFPPFDRLSAVLPEIGAGVVVDDQTGRDPPAIVDAQGDIRLARRQVVAGGPASELIRAHELVPEDAGGLAPSRGTRCAVAEGPMLIQFRPRSSVTVDPGALEVTLVPGRSRGLMSVYVNSGSGYPPGPTKILSVHGDDEIVRTEFPHRLVEARLGLPRGSAACIRSVTVADYRTGPARR